MARRKITEAPELEADSLPELTAQQFGFVKGLLDGKSASDAYRGSYNCGKMQPNTIWAAASRLRADSNVAAWLSRARQAELGNAKITLDQHVQRLDRLQDLAISTGNIGAAVQAEQIIGKVLGHHVERFQDVTADPEKLLRDIAAVSPELAAQLAKDNGIRLEQETQH